MAGKKGRSGGGLGRAKPLEQHLLEGTLKKRHEKLTPSRTTAQVVSVPIPPPPAEAEKSLKANWTRLAETLKERVRTTEDLDAFKSLVSMITERDAAYELMTSRGRYDTDNNGVPRIAPHTKLWMDTNAKLLLYFGRFGMTPADRVRNAVYEERTNGNKEADAKPEDEFASDAA